MTQYEDEVMRERHKRLNESNRRESTILHIGITVIVLLILGAIVKGYIL